MAKPAPHSLSGGDTDALVERLCSARRWALEIFDTRGVGIARDLAWALAGLARDHDPDTYVPWSRVRALETEQLKLALELAAQITRAIRLADALQPHLVRNKEARQ